MKILLNLFNHICTQVPMVTSHHHISSLSLTTAQSVLSFNSKFFLLLFSAWNHSALANKGLVGRQGEWEDPLDGEEPLYKTRGPQLEWNTMVLRHHRRLWLKATWCRVVAPGSWWTVHGRSGGALAWHRLWFKCIIWTFWESKSRLGPNSMFGHKNTFVNPCVNRKLQCSAKIMRHLGQDRTAFYKLSWPGRNSFMRNVSQDGTVILG